jgi:hypothetical protein
VSTDKSGSCGCVLAIVLIILAVPFWHFLKASWPTWGFLLLGFALLLISKKYEKNPFVVATIKVLVPIMVALFSLMALELLFGTFAFFNPDRVAAYEETVLNVHFAITELEKALGFVIPLSVTLAVAFLCLTVGNWKYSAILAKGRGLFRFVSIFILVVSSFTFFRHAGVNRVLDEDKMRNEGLYEMELAKEERAIARGVAAQELKEGLTHLDEESKKNFAAFFGGLNDACKTRDCFGYHRYAFLGRNPAREAMMAAVAEKAKDDYQHFHAVDSGLIAESNAQRKLPAALQGHFDEWSFLRNREISLLLKKDAADVPLASSHSPAEVQLTKRPSSELDLQENKEIIREQAGRANRMEEWAKEEREKTTEAFAAALAASIPEVVEGLLGEYIKELTDVIAEFVVRPTVDFMFKQGFRGSSIEEIHLVQDKVPMEVHETFGSFRPQFTEAHSFASRESVAREFSSRELNTKNEIEAERVEFKRIEEHEKEREIE